MPHHQVRPIAAIGAGAVVKHAHWPAYRMAGYEVDCVYDLNREAAESLAGEYGVYVCESLDELIARQPEAIFDVALPASRHAETLRQLPQGSFVLLQKPMGETLADADEILRICEERNLRAAVNFQLRFAPYVLEARRLLAEKAIGEVLQVDCRVCVYMPWQDWDFLAKSPRMEIVYHSIHYLDLIRCLLGEPAGVQAKTIKHPSSPDLHSSRSSIVLDYGDWLGATVTTYHGHKWGPDEQESYFRIEGTEGCLKFQMGLNMNYPDGESDWLRLNRGDGWAEVAFEGSWFPHAFRGTMSQMMRWADSGERPESEIHDAHETMALVEDCYRASGSMP